MAGKPDSEWKSLQHNNSQTIEQQLRLAYSAMESNPDGIIICDINLPDQPIIYINPAFEKITGYQKEEVIGKNCRFLQSDDNEQPEINEIRLAIKEGREEQVELRNYRKNGTLFWNELHLAPVKNEQGEVTHYIGTIADITERKNIEEQLLFEATHDAITGLPNRALLNDRIEQAINYALRAKTMFGLVHIDLDQFKLINDSLGHSIGDKFLKIMAKRLVACVPENDTVSRIGGDEFIIILNDLKYEQALITVANKLLQAVSSAIVIDGKELHITASIGIVIYPRDGGDRENLLKNVDTAMYLAKGSGRNNFKFFAQDMNQKNIERLHLENDLRHALKKQEFILNYQTLVNLKTNLIVGVEVLVRWKRSNGEIILPVDFINVAEEIGLIMAIGEWVIDHACLQFKNLLDKNLNKFRLAINVSPRQFKELNFVKKILEIIDHRQVTPNLIELEFTENILMEDLSESNNRLKELKKLGFNIVVDDFGIGYSNLNYLKQLSVDKIKIDKSFTEGLPQAKDNAAIVSAIIAMAKALNVAVLAEGVETKEQLAFLKNCGCDEAQGFYFSKPIDGKALEKLLLPD